MNDAMTDLIAGLTDAGTQVEEYNTVPAKLTYLASQFGAPTVCPSCGKPLEIKGVDVMCVNEDCREKKFNVMSSFLKKLKIKNVDVASLRNMIIKDFDDLLCPWDDVRVPGKSVRNFRNELTAKMFSVSPKKLFCAMNFKGLSEKLLSKIIDWFGWKNFEAAMENGGCGPAMRKKFEKNAPPGIGEITLSKFLEDAGKNYANVKKITSDPRYTWVEAFDAEASRGTDKPGKGISVCFTGSLATMTRSAASAKAEEAGFEVKSSVSKGLTYLVTNDTSSGSSKNKKAQALGTAIINEQQFLELLGKYNSDLGNLNDI